jgi:hypothetical protein
VAKFKGVKAGDLINVETRSESGVAEVIDVTDDGVVWRPVVNHFQKRLVRPKLKAHEIVKVYRKLSR